MTEVIATDASKINAFLAEVFTTVGNGILLKRVGGAHRTHQIVVVKLLFVLSVASADAHSEWPRSLPKGLLSDLAARNFAWRAWVRGPTIIYVPSAQ
jgi:hypothetical protein